MSDIVNGFLGFWVSALLEQAQSHGYGKSWTPPVKKAPAQVRSAEPRLRFDKAQSAYVDVPLPKFERDDTLRQKVRQQTSIGRSSQAQYIMTESGINQSRGVRRKEIIG